MNISACSWIRTTEPSIRIPRVFDITVSDSVVYADTSKKRKPHNGFRCVDYSQRYASIPPKIASDRCNTFRRNGCCAFGNIHSPIPPNTIKKVTPNAHPISIQNPFIQVSFYNLYHINIFYTIYYSKCILSVLDAKIFFKRGYFFKSGSSSTSVRASVRLASTSLIFWSASIARSPTPHCFWP